LCKAALQHGIVRVQLQILFFEDFPDCFHVWYDYPMSEAETPCG
jgi:hypothetical protein